MFVPLSIKTHSFNLDGAIVPLKLKSLSMETQSRADSKSSGFLCQLFVRKSAVFSRAKAWDERGNGKVRLGRDSHGCACSIWNFKENTFAV